MDYIEWSREYFSEAKKIKEKIERLKEELKRSGKQNKKALYTRITILYSMYLEQKNSGEILVARAGGEKRAKKNTVA